MGAPAAAAASAGGSARSHKPATKRRPVTPSDAGEASQSAGGAIAAGGIISLRANGTDAGTIRVSVGIEDVADLIWDLEQALAQLDDAA